MSNFSPSDERLAQVDNSELSKFTGDVFLHTFSVIINPACFAFCCWQTRLKHGTDWENRSKNGSSKLTISLDPFRLLESLVLSN